ncbi:unnamed protein product, partial [Mesorhabditis spiculigera]
MDILPGELLRQIVSLCDFGSIIRLRQISRRLQYCANEVLFEQGKASIGNELLKDHESGCFVGREKLRMGKMTSFLRAYMHNLQVLRLADADCTLTLTNVCQLSQAVPNLACLEIIISGQLALEPDALRGLAMFRNLKELRISDWSPRMVIRKGGCYRQESLPPMPKLETLILESSRDSVTKILTQMRAEGICLPELRNIEPDQQVVSWGT